MRDRPAALRTILPVLCAGLVLLFAPVFAARAEVVDTAFVRAALERGALLWDVRGWPEYRKGHLPGAVAIGAVGKVLRNEHDEDYIPLERMAKVLGDAGIDPAAEVVVYGDKAGASTYFALLTLQYLGASRAYAYHGGIEDWVAAGLPLSVEPATRPALSLTLTPRPEVLIDTREVLERVRSGNAQIVDARTPAEYSGTDIRALRGGHLPGAVNIPYEQNWRDPEAMRKLAKRQIRTTEGLDLKPMDELRALYKGLDPDKETVVYCQSGVRAAVTGSLLRELGFRNVKVYDSSWLDYGNRLDAPAESQSFLNVGALLSRIGGLESRIGTLEEELARLRGGR